jgi:RNA polymerase sigma-70 factor, ECF subfamily
VPASEKPEVELARALLNGDKSAFEPFVQVFGAKVFHYTYLMCGQREDAEEVAQDTLLRIFENFDQLKDAESVKPWVFRIAKNFCLMKRRKSVFAPQRELSLDELMPAKNGEGERPLQIADVAELPEDEILRGELNRELEKALQDLPDIYRSAVLLRDVEGMSTGEAAAVLEVSEDVVKQRLHRGRLALRKSLDGYVRTAERK